MAIAPIPPVSGVGAAAPANQAARAAAPGFGEAIQRGLAEVSNLEHTADKVAHSVATGGGAQIHDLMIATSQSSLSVELLSQVRNKAVEAYQEIMRMQL